MRNCLSKNRIVEKKSEFVEMVMDYKIEMQDIVDYGEGSKRIIYKDKHDFITEHGSSNIVISLW